MNRGNSACTCWKRNNRKAFPQKVLVGSKQSRIFAAREPPSLSTMLKSGVVLFLYPMENQGEIILYQPDNEVKLVSEQFGKKAGGVFLRHSPTCGTFRAGRPCFGVRDNGYVVSFGTGESDRSGKGRRIGCAPVRGIFRHGRKRPKRKRTPDRMRPVERAVTG